MKLQDKIYTEKELEEFYLKFSKEKNEVIFYKDNIGNQYLFERVDHGLQYLLTIKNSIKVCSSWD